MLKRIVIGVVIGVVIGALVGLAVAQTGNPHTIDRYRLHSSTSSPVPLAAISLVASHHNRHKVSGSRLHHRLGTAYKRGRAGSVWCQTYHVWDEGINTFTGSMQIRGDVAGKLCYDLRRNTIVSFTDANTWANVGPLVWSVNQPVPYNVVKGHGRVNGSDYIYRRIYFSFDGNWIWAGLPFHQTVIPWVAITARGNGTFTFAKKSLG